MSVLEIEINTAASGLEVEIPDTAKPMDVDIHPDGGVSFTGSSVKLAEVTLLASAWTGSDNLHRQVVEIEGVTPKSLVDLQPSAAQLRVFHEKDLAFTTENDNGVVTVFAIGDRPTNDYTIQATVTEVRV